AINGAKVISVRDEESKAYLVKYGFRGKISVNPDSALSLGDISSRFHFEKNNHRDKVKIALHLPLDKDKDYDAIKPHLIELLNDLKRSQSSVEFNFLVDHGLDRNNYQYKFFERISQEIGVSWFIKEYITPEDTLSFISNCDVVVTTKLHVAITSYALGVKPVGISKHPKTKRFFKQVGLEYSHFDLFDLVNEDKREAIKSIIFNDDKIVVSNNIIKQALNNK